VLVVDIAGINGGISYNDIVNNDGMRQSNRRQHQTNSKQYVSNRAAME